MKKSLLSFAFYFTALYAFSQNSFTPNNILISRSGSGTAAAATANTATPAFLDEYTPDGVFVQSIPLPVQASGANKRFVLSGPTASEGLLLLSANNAYVTLIGYDADTLTKDLTASSSTSVPRVIAIVGTNAKVNTSMSLNAYNNNSPRSVITDNGKNFWMTGSYNLLYTAAGATTDPVTVAVGSQNCIGIFNGQLYTSSNQPLHKIGIVGTGVQTNGAQTITPLPGYPLTVGPAGFIFFDTNNDNVPDLLYAADGPNGLAKYSFDGTTWTMVGLIDKGNFYGSPLKGIAGIYSAGNVVLYVNNSSRFYKVVDTALPAAAPAVTVKQLAVAAANQSFRGLSFTPGTKINAKAK